MLTRDVQRRAMIGRRAWERKPEGDVHRASERRDLDGRHADVVIRGNHRIELAAHRAHEDRVGGKGSRDSGRSCCRSKKLVVLVAESPTVAGVRV
jgi:hypothetical protein